VVALSLDTVDPESPPSDALSLEPALTVLLPVLSSDVAEVPSSPLALAMPPPSSVDSEESRPSLVTVDAESVTAVTVDA
jgi:hypothetical protein